MATAIFHPQAWVNNYAVEVDAEGPIEWEVGEVADDLEDYTYKSDELRYHANAPDWAREWHGPFDIEIRR